MQINGQIPPMLVQPYVENAVWHGLRYKASKGKLTIRISEQDHILTITIEDDGIGRHKSDELKTANQQKNKSTGLRNTADRLELINTLYDTGYTVDIMDAYPESEECGTKVVIRISNPSHNE